MKIQGVWVTRILSFVIMVFVLGFMGYHIVSAMSDPVATAGTVLYTAEEAFPATGYLVRDERLLPAPEGVYEVSLSEGERVSRGGVIAWLYRSQEALSVNARRRELERRLAEMEYANRSESGVEDPALLERQIIKSLISVIGDCDNRSLSQLSNDSLSLKALIFKREVTFRDDTNLAFTLDSLRAEYESLEKQAEQANTYVRADQPGAFSAYVDGWETVLTPELMDTISAADFGILTANPPETAHEDSLGKLALGFEWQFCVLLPEEKAALLHEGGTATLRFADDSRATRQFQVKRLGPPENGRRIVVFSSRQNVAEFINVRKMTADIVYRTFTGLRVPREAVRVDAEGQTGVFCLVMTQIVWKKVDILRDFVGENYYLVEYTPDKKGSLLVGDEMIIRGKDLYDGKVIGT